MSSVFVVDTEHRSPDPGHPGASGCIRVHPGAARRLLARGRAAVAVWWCYPFMLILKRVVPDAQTQPLRLKIDPGSRITGLAFVTESPAAPQRRLQLQLQLRLTATAMGHPITLTQRRVERPESEQEAALPPHG
jgi:hypothetical protein